MELVFEAPVFHWRGPSPYHFVALPPDEAELVAEMAQALTYGWGMIPVAATIGETRWTTSMYAKDGGYVLPLRDAIRRAEGIDLGDVVEVRLALDV